METDSQQWYRELDNQIFRLARIYKMNFEEADWMPDKIKLSSHELGVLQILEWEPDTAVSIIAEQLGIPKSTLTSVINRMEKKNIIIRKKDPDDKRVLKLKLTQKGLDMQLKRKENKINIFNFISEALENGNDRKTLIRLLEKISSANKLRQKNR